MIFFAQLRGFLRGFLFVMYNDKSKENLKKGHKLDAETAREAQKKSVVKRKQNKNLLEYLTDEGYKLTKDDDNKRRVNILRLVRKTWKDAIEKEGLSRRIIFEKLIGTEQQQLNENQQETDPLTLEAVYPNFIATENNATEPTT